MKKMISILTIVAVVMTAAFAAPQAGDVTLNINGKTSSKIAHKFSSEPLTIANFANAGDREISEKTLDMTTTLEQEVGYYNLYTNHKNQIDVTAKASTLKSASGSDIIYTMNGTKVASDDVEIKGFMARINEKTTDGRVYTSKILLTLDSDSLMLAAGDASYSADLTVSVRAI